MDRQDIEHNLALLGEQLEELNIGTPIRLLMIGGAFMLTQIGNRPTTTDIDVMIKDISDPQNSDAYRIFKNAVRFVAYDTGIPQAWLSDTISDFLAIAGPLPQDTLWRTFGQYLEIYIPPKDFILAHKLLAAGNKDMCDIAALRNALNIRTRQQAQEIVDRYIENKDLQDMHMIQQTLTILFRE